MIGRNEVVPSPGEDAAAPAAAVCPTHGEVSVESEPNKGSTFALTLPLGAGA